jgi:methionyl-tRNA formyltransferase
VTSAVLGATAGELAGELSVMGADLLADTLPDIETGRAPRIPQDESNAFYAPMIRKEEARVDFSKSPREICDLIRGMNPKPAAFAFLNGENFKFWRAIPVVSSAAARASAGTVISVSNEGITVAARGGAVLITAIQAPGKRPMRTEEYLRGSSINTGAVFA